MARLGGWVNTSTFGKGLLTTVHWALLEGHPTHKEAARVVGELAGFRNEMAGFRYEMAGFRWVLEGSMGADVPADVLGVVW